MSTEIDPILHATYDPTLVAASVAVATLAGYTALTLTARVSAAARVRRTVWLAAGATAMGVGIWGMHFVGMLALRLPVPVTYNAIEVAGSVAVAWVASALALAVASRAALSARRLAVAGVALGGAIVGMHYTGMAAMRLEGTVRYDGWRVVASVAVAITVALVALWIAFQFRDDAANDQRTIAAMRKWGAALLMGVAVAGMHYTAMWAAHFHGPHSGAGAGSRATTGMAHHQMAILVAVVTILILGATLTAALIERRWGVLAKEAARRQEELERTVAERTAHLAAAVAAQDRLVRIIEATPDVVCIAAPRDEHCVYLNRAGRRLLQFADDEDLATLPLRAIYPPAVGAVVAETVIPSALRDGVWEGPSMLVARDGREIPVSMVFIAHREADGTRPHFSAIMRDMTRHRELETQLRQAQKMEAVGRLAGGVAHDFNNMLSAIISYGDLLTMDFETGTPRVEDVREITNAALRAADLTRQLLAFSRQQVLEPRVLCPNEVIGGLEKMLRRLIGEHITITMALTDAVSRIKADPGQLEQVILNLAVNARDAMPSGGHLTFETADVELGEAYVASHPIAVPGQYVMIAVSDTGSGMDRATQSQIFEPFFTTKEQGKGTGLGLATVYGIVKQSDGYIWVYSEPNKGSTFKVYLPRVGAASHGRAIDAAEAGPARGRESVLFVEDEPALRAAGAQILTRHGYTVYEAASGEEALTRWQAAGAAIDLIATDVVMPGLTGPQTVDRLRAVQPAVKVLFMSGYTDAAVLEHGVSMAGAAFLQKPFSAATLTQKVREVLDGNFGNPIAPKFGRALQ